MPLPSPLLRTIRIGLSRLIPKWPGTSPKDLPPPMKPPATITERTYLALFIPINHLHWDKLDLGPSSQEQEQLFGFEDEMGGLRGKARPYRQVDEPETALRIREVPSRERR